jgi:putative membrane protein
MHLTKNALLLHVGQPPAPHDLWTSWSLEPVVLLGFALAIGIYSRGVRAAWRRAGRGRGMRVDQVRFFAAGMVALAIALISPVDAVGSALFSIHMVQHLLLMLVAAPLIVLGAPAQATLWAVSPAVRRSVTGWWLRTRWLQDMWHAVSNPFVLWWAHTLAVWLWHVPRLYEAALRVDVLHDLEHLSFFVTALAFWWLTIHPAARRRLGFGGGVVYLFASAMQSGALGALLVFATRPWYTIHDRSTLPWGLTPLEDQHLAGVIMWAPASVVYLLAIGVYLAGWLRSERRLSHRTSERAFDHPPVRGPMAYADVTSPTYPRSEDGR